MTRQRYGATVPPVPPARRFRPAGPAARARYAKRRQRRLSRVENDLTAAQWAALLAGWDGCAYCRAPGPGLQRDCVMPVARGGRYTVENVVPACASCNASKHDDEVTGWLRRKKLDEQAFLLRHALVLRSLRAATADAAAADEPGAAGEDGSVAGGSAVAG